MEYENFLREKERVADLPVQEQKDFYAKVLEEESQESSVRLHAYFEYAKLFYYEGDFRKARDILEPFVISYQSYEYIPEMISCFNLTGVASQCEGEYVLSRYFYNLALKVVREQQANNYFAYEYNNIALTYIAEGNYDTALAYIQKAEEYLPLSDGKMGAYIYLNKADIYNHLNRLPEAEEAYEISIHRHNGREILPDDTIICGVSLYYRMGDRERYADCIRQVLERLDHMYASEFIDACGVVFECSLKERDYRLVEIIIEKMDRYMQTHLNESKVGLKIEELKYTYAKEVGNKDAMLAALQGKSYYYNQVVSRLEQQRAGAIDEYLDTHRHLQEAVQNEMQANRAKTRFLANVSHDIRTPMNAIIGITTLMEHALYDPVKLGKYLSKIKMSNQHMMELINDLLDMNRIESGVMHLNIEQVRLEEQIRQIREMIGTQAAGKHQKFQILTRRIRHENVLADSMRLRQVLLNILSNSVKYTPEGGTVRLEIEENACSDPGMASYQFAIADNGIGMEPELVEKIFDPFIRGEDSVVNKIQGTGLGMAITKNIVDMMGGTIRVDSKAGAGTCVTVCLTLEIDQAEDAGADSGDAPETSGESILKGMRFLCAEDNELNAEILTALLEIEGASCRVCEDGKKITEVFKTVKPGEYDAILMDIQMPGMNGYEATQQIRRSSNPLGQTIPIIAMTANAYTDDIKRSFDVGMNAHISKPIDMAVLEKTMRRVNRLSG